MNLPVYFEVNSGLLAFVLPIATQQLVKSSVFLAAETMSRRWYVARVRRTNRHADSLSSRYENRVQLAAGVSYSHGTSRGLLL
jgi:hypothetical protein